MSIAISAAIALAVCSFALLGPQVGAAETVQSNPPALVEAPRGHAYPGAPKDTPRCRKLLRQIEIAREKENYYRLNKLARRYNRTCRVK